MVLITLQVRNMSTHQCLNWNLDLYECIVNNVVHTQRKKGTKTVPLGYYCYKWYPFYKGALFFP